MKNDKQIVNLKFLLIYSFLLTIVIDFFGLIQNSEEFLFAFLSISFIIYGLDLIGIIKITLRKIIFMKDNFKSILNKFKNIFKKEKDIKISKITEENDMVSIKIKKKPIKKVKSTVAKKTKPAAKAKKTLKKTTTTKTVAKVSKPKTKTVKKTVKKTTTTKTKKTVKAKA